MIYFTLSEIYSMNMFSFYREISRRAKEENIEYSNASNFMATSYKIEGDEVVIGFEEIKQ